jgi:crotonobetainyl-CoA:carnitine CoA-transferase CaiB-like acyl-CoA transferase
LAGPYASRILADAGAEIIKVQTRAVPGTLADTETPYFQTWNRNKRAVTLNLSNPEGIRLARLLISKSDAVIDSFSPRVMENMGLLPIEMCFEQPGLIWLSMSAFGATGPWRNYVAFAQTVHALTGLTSQNSDSDGTPLGLGFSFADHISGIMGSVALLGALEVRKHDGRGQWIDFSQYEALSTLFILGNKCESSDSLSDQFVFPCYGTDKWCAVRLSNDVDWDKFLSVLDIQYRTRTPQVLGPMNNAGDKKLLLNDISIVTRRFDCLHLARTLQSQGVAAGPVQKATDLISDEQMIARGYFVKSKGACFDKSLTGTWGSERLAYRQAPKLGQDNQYVFQELLGIGEEDIRDLMGSGVIW